MRFELHEPTNIIGNRGVVQEVPVKVESRQSNVIEEEFEIGFDVDELYGSEDDPENVLKRYMKPFDNDYMKTANTERILKFAKSFKKDPNVH